MPDLLPVRFFLYVWKSLAPLCDHWIGVDERLRAVANEDQEQLRVISIHIIDEDAADTTTDASVLDEEYSSHHALYFGNTSGPKESQALFSRWRNNTQSSSDSYYGVRSDLLLNHQSTTSVLLVTPKKR